mmetsp:Transcript_11688/g.25680  ORF Transcript_11688/g.25680 Transcript_11688/m.25680 type:complete len:381 (+) Transcript_11688:506-1648(+)
MLWAFLAIRRAHAKVEPVACRVGAEWRAVLGQRHPWRARHASAGRCILPSLVRAHAGIAAVCSDEAAVGAAKTLLGGRGRRWKSWCLRTSQGRAIGLLLAPVGWTDATVQSITRGENAVRNTPGPWQLHGGTVQPCATRIVALPAGSTAAGVATIGCGEQQPRAAGAVLFWLLFPGTNIGSTIGFGLDAAPRTSAHVETICRPKVGHGQTPLTGQHGGRTGHQGASRFILQPGGTTTAGVATIRGLKGVARAAGAVRHVLRVHGKLHLGTLQTGALGFRQIAICRTCAGVQAITLRKCHERLTSAFRLRFGTNSVGAGCPSLPAAGATHAAVATVLEHKPWAARVVGKDLCDCQAWQKSIESKQTAHHPVGVSSESQGQA